jgi:hypothetical protein
MRMPEVDNKAAWRQETAPAAVREVQIPGRFMTDVSGNQHDPVGHAMQKYSEKRELLRPLHRRKLPERNSSFFPARTWRISAGQFPFIAGIAYKLPDWTIQR